MAELSGNLRTMLIRPMLAEDARTVAEFYADIRLDTVPIIHSVDEVAEWIITTRIARGSSFVAEVDGGVVGWLDVAGSDLDQLYVRRHWTGRGIGLHLLNFAKERSPGELALFTFQVNSGARRFYLREGFREVQFGDGTQNEEAQPDVKLAWP